MSKTGRDVYGNLLQYPTEEIGDSDESQYDDAHLNRKGKVRRVFAGARSRLSDVSPVTATLGISIILIIAAGIMRLSYVSKTTQHGEQPPPWRLHTMVLMGLGVTPWALMFMYFAMQTPGVSLLFI
jgi:hypothetical protein